MHMTKPKPIQCPKCKSIEINLDETGTWVTTHYCDGGHNNDPGEYFKVEGTCRSCKHVWRIKGEVTVSSDLQDRFDENIKLFKAKQL